MKNKIGSTCSKLKVVNNFVIFKDGHDTPFISKHRQKRMYYILNTMLWNSTIKFKPANEDSKVKGNFFQRFVRGLGPGNVSKVFDKERCWYISRVNRFSKPSFLTEFLSRI